MQHRAQANKIRRIAQERRIPFLVHFTPVENLPSIMQHGIVSRTWADQMGIAYQFTDSERLDGRLDAISTSIAFPNDRFLNALSYRIGYQKLAVIVMQPDILWEKEAAFCITNAANKYIRHQALESLQTAEAFEGVFYASTIRENNFLKPCDPTDVQAEVMVMDHIEKEFIKSVYFFSEQACKPWKRLCYVNGVRYQVDSGFFFNSRRTVRRAQA